MADVITRFKLETTQYDSKLRDAAKSLKEIGRMAEIGGKDFTNFSQKQVEAARALGNTASGANNAKDRLKDLVGAFNDTAKAYNNLSAAQQQSDFGKAMSQSLEQLQTRIKETKQELYGLGDGMKGGGGLFGGGKLDGMLQVFGGNVMTKIAGMGAGLVTELGDAVKQGIELAKQGEGIRIAFQRLGRGDILDGLREATHGTVTDLELMKAAVKFNDFKLPLDELGTMLAFAQQKAKDTGQSVDYMVDSIVTGLGRKSLMILDNLGLSAAQIKEKMKETGDMTKAVGAIIREEMVKAGDYVETAADRATQANVKLENAMTRLGETFQPLTDTATSMWTSIKVGALDLLNNAIKPLINALAEAGALGSGARATTGFNRLGGGSKVDRMIGRLGNGKTAGAYSIYQRQLEEFDKYINNKRFQIAAFGSDNSSIAQSSKQRLQADLDGALKMRAEYVKRAQELHNKVPSPLEPATTPGGAIGGGGGISRGGLDLLKIAFDSNAASAAATRGIDTMPSVYSMADREAMRAAMGIATPQWDAKQDISKQWRIGKNGQLTNKPNGKEDEDEKNQTAMLDGITAMNTSLQNIFGGIQQLGFEVPQELMNILSVMQTIVGIVSAIQTLSTVKLFGLAGGGIVPRAAGGYMIPGNSFSGDNVFAGNAWVNSGELVLNKAQQSTLAAQLQGSGVGNMQLEAIVRGEDLRFVLNSNGRRTGRGEIVTTNFR